jgi:NTP pyrophosphatase (non-canonical NTP hydrolase)
MAMTRLQWLLTKVAEEAGELAKEALKAQQFGLDSKKVTRDGEFTNLESMQLEFNDLLGTLRLLNVEIKQAAIFADQGLALAKIEKLERYYGLLKNMGSVE